MPSNLANTEQNAKLLAEYCYEMYGVISIANLKASVVALTGQLDLVPGKTQEQIAKEFEERERQRIEREKLENSKPFDIEARTKKILADKERKERQATAQAQIDHFVNSWSVNSTIPGRIDEVKSQAGRHFLANLKMGRGNVYDAELTLRVVQKLYHCETAGEMEAKKDQAINELNFGKLDDAARRRAEEAKHGAGLGNMPRYY